MRHRIVILSHITVAMNQPPGPSSLGKHSRTEEQSPTPSVKKSRIKSFRDRWNVPEDNQWDEFHQTWWGKSWTQSESFLVNEFICEHLGVLQGTEGFLFQRAEYRAFTNRIQAAREGMSHYDLWGCLLLGQPGIGKSAFLLVFLLICMSKEEPVLFTNYRGHTFLIDKEGVLWKPVAEFTTEDLSYSTTRIWSLVDSPQAKVPLPDSVTGAYPSQIFFVAAVSPDASQYKELAKGHVSQYWMSAWTDRELYTLLNGLKHSPVLRSNKEQFETLPALRALRVRVGPCPRDMITMLLDPKKFELNTNQALETLVPFQTIIDLIRAPLRFSNDISHSIILVQRLGPVSETTFGSDEYYVRLKTQAIKQKVLDQYSTLELNEAQWLFRVCAGIGPKGAVFVGNLFEGLAIRYTSGEEHSPNTFRLFAQMTRVTTSRKKFPIRYIYEIPGHKQTIVVDGDCGIVLKDSPLEPSEPSEHPPSANGTNMPWSSRRRVEYRDEKAISIDPSSYYCPSALNNPLFDAFFFEVLSDKVILWVLQMTIQRNHDGAKKGFEIIKTAMTRAQHLWTSLEVKVRYVLVVAYKEPGLDIEWNFASEFDECPGDVFIQQMDLDVLSQGSSFKLEDIFGETVQ